ncbi:uncharacterized protein LOC121372523 [Gigantopelta aegis]|uniref:uncharacterized protein LOC121372523 n=1 Tax=Gigantopelta aegis TaxID=1735272 RepID=UPI001B88BA2D|nr:uncharacterized protein LOC121372523 [Gigantopelta aegis]
MLLFLFLFRHVRSTSLWIGLSKNSANETFQWCSVLDPSYNNTVDKSNFKSDVNQSELCMAVDTQSALWETRPCHEQLPFICMKTLTYSSMNRKNAFMRFIDKIFEFYSDPNNTATYLVLPVFVLLILLCCLPYLCHRLRDHKKANEVEIEIKHPDIEDTGKYMKYSTYFGSFRNKRPINFYQQFNNEM